jgi:hypothetical protein
MLQEPGYGRIMRLMKAKPCDLDGSQVITKSYPILVIDGGKGGYFSNPYMVERKSALFGRSR